MFRLNEIISERLRPLVNAQKYKNGKKKKQQDIANEWNVSKNVLSKAINGLGLSVDNAINISQELGLSLDYIYGQSDYKTIEDCVIDIIEKHIYIDNRNSELPDLRISTPLASYLKDRYLIQQVKSYQKDESELKKQLQNCKDDFVAILRADKSKDYFSDREAVK